MTSELATTEPEAAIVTVISDEMSVAEIVDRAKKVQEVQGAIMQEGTHYGTIPGTKRPTLLKPGAEILGLVFKLAPQFNIIEKDRDGDHLSLIIECVLYHQVTGARLGSGLGSCSTKESKYAWRQAQKTCPECGTEAIMKSKNDPGWYCWTKKDGCGSNFQIDEPRIIDQITGRVPNPDVFDMQNTVLKMATKRAHIAAILFVTCASEIFTQDIEDMPDLNGFTSPSPKAAADTRAKELIALFKAAKTIDLVDKYRDEVGKNQQKFRDHMAKLGDARDAAIERITGIKREES